MPTTKFLWQVGDTVSSGGITFRIGKIALEQLDDNSYRVTLFDQVGKPRSYLSLVERGHPEN